MKKLLDLYSGAGLAAIGYKQAGFKVTGIDIDEKSCYAGDTWIQADVFDILSDIDFCRQFDAIHASPPCQRYSQSTAVFRAAGKWYPDLVQPTRVLLDKIGLPYVIENVPAAPVRPDIVLHGWMFGLKVMRRRHFELGNWFMMQPGVGQRIGSVKDGDFISIFGNGGYRTHSGQQPGWRPKFDKGKFLPTWHFAMGIPDFYKFKAAEISEGIPPAYTKYIGEHLSEYLDRKIEDIFSNACM